MGLDFWICLLTITGAAIGAGAVALAIDGVIVRAVHRHNWVWLQTEIERCRRSWRVTVIALAIAITMGQFSAIAADWRRGAWIPVILAVCWLVIHLALIGEAVMFHRLRMDVAENRRVRRSRTQVALLRRMTAVAVIVVGVTLSLFLLPELHAVGASIFASAGLAGIIAGLAAQSTLANMFAGMQLACTDAVRIDDVVVVEGEWGWIEEITLTYVIVHIWDERRLVLPTNYFTTMAFQNWTRHQSQILGSVILHLDYATPLAALREHAEQVIRASPLWDRKDWVLQVTSTTETTMVVRVLASAKDGPTSWDLCCDIREALLVFLQQRHPEALPVRRLLNLTDGHGDQSRPGSETGDRFDLTWMESQPAPEPPRRVKIARRTDIPRRADLRRAERSRAR